MMAESLGEAGDDSEKNFILAKLMSLFGDTVDFDVINLVAQENEWNEEKCIELLKVLGDYKNPDTTPLTSDVLENIILDSQSKALSRIEVQRAPQIKKTGYSAATSKPAKSKMAGHNPGNPHLGLAGMRHHSPSKAFVPKPKERSTESQEHHDKVKALIESGTPVLIILRGLPGSGKTTLAKNLLSLQGAKGGCSHSTDNFFLVRRGGKGATEYQYDPLRLGEAHEWNRVQVLRAIAHGVSPIIVDNTNAQKWEMLPYVEMALEPWKAEKALRKMAANGSIPKKDVCSSLGPARMSMKGKKCSCGYTVRETSKMPYQIELLEPLTWWYKNPSRLAKVNQHGVSQKKIMQMLTHFEFDVTGHSLVQHILKRKSNSLLNPPNQNARPGIQAERGPAPACKAVPPLFNMMPKRYPGSDYGAKPRPSPPPNIPGNNAFKHNSVNQFPNPVGFSTSPYPHLLGFPSKPQEMGMFAPVAPSNPMFAPNQHNAAKNTQPDSWASKGQPRKDEYNPLPLNLQSIFSKSASNVSFLNENENSNASGIESEQNDKRTGSLTTSETNLFEKSSNSGTNSFMESECVEMTEEELKEWMEANSSRWEWDSSDEDSGDESNEPKPARSLKQRHRDNSSEKISTVGKTSVSGAKSLDGEAEESEEVPEWVTEEFDPMTSWNPSECSSDSSKDPDPQVPLPPRDSKRKRLVENPLPPPSLDDNFELLEKPCGDVDQVQLGIIQQIQTLLGELGVRNKELDSPLQTCGSSADDNSDVLLKDEVSVAFSSESVCSDAEESLSALKSKDINSSEKVNVPLEDDDEPLISFFDPPLSEIGAVETVNSIITDKETKITQSLENFLEDIRGNNMEVHEEKIDDPFLTAFNVILSKVPADAKMEMDNLPSGNTISIESCLKENATETLSIIASTDTKDQNSDSKKHFKYLSSVFGEDLKWFDGAFQKTSTDNNDQVNDEKDVIVQVPKQLTSNISVFDNISGPQPLEFLADLKDAETLESLKDEPFSAKLQAKDVELVEDVDVLSSVKLRVSEKGSSTDAFKSDTAFLVEFKETVKEDSHSSTVAQTSSPVQHDKENEISVQSQEDPSEISDCLEKNLTSSEGEQEKDVPSLIAQGIFSKRSLENLQEIFKAIAFNADSNMMHDSSVNETPFEKENVDKNYTGIISDGKKVQAVSSCSNNEIGASNANEERTTNNPEETSEPELQSAQGMKKEPSLLDFLENLKKKREATMHNPEKAVESECQPDQGMKEKITLQELHENVEKDTKSQENPSSSKEDKECELHNIIGMSECTSDVWTGKTVSICMAAKEQEESEDFNNDWGALATGEGSPTDFDDSKETFPLVLDSNFIEQICQKFGNPYQDSMDESSKLPGQFGVTVQVPAYLARKLHECWLKTQWDAILDEEETSQKMLQEDELLARQLQEFEKEDLKEKRDQSDSSSATPNLREIMDMEMAMAIYKEEQDKKMLLNHRNDLSTRLSWDSLTKEFPQVPQDVITQIFSAYNFSYNNTREALLSSLPDFERDLHEESVKDVVSPEALAAQEKALMEKAKLESIKNECQFQNTELPEEGEKAERDVEGGWEALVDQARKSAALNRRLQKERHAQAQAASRSGNPSAAAYYCRMASLHKQKAEEANREAANILSRVFTGEYNNLKGSSTGNREISRPPITLDMHTMSVLEALRVVNAFLDAHAEWMRTRKSRPNVEITRKNSQVKMVTLFLITGRGVNSQGGIPRIKPAVVKQLEKRGVWYEELNPGLLRVMVSASLPPAKKM